MTLVRYEPWSILDQLRKEMAGVFDREGNADNGSVITTSDWTPAVDIKETENSYVIAADIPGVDPNDIEVHMENGVLSIKGERRTESSDEKKGYKRVERSYGSFYRRFSLPDSADANKISAKSKDGVLEITINKQEQSQPRKIEVQH